MHFFTFVLEISRKFFIVYDVTKLMTEFFYRLDGTHAYTYMDTYNTLHVS